jgi:hypothetical protein
MVRQQGGTMTAGGTEGGAVFRIRFPLIVAEAAEVPATILMAETDSAVRGLTAAVLERLGYRVLQAGGAEDAVRAVESGMPIHVVVAGVELAPVVDRLRVLYPGVRELDMTALKPLTPAHVRRILAGVLTRGAEGQPLKGKSAPV